MSTEPDLFNEDAPPTPPLPRPTMDVARACFKKHWGFDTFKPAQELLIQHGIDGKDSLGVLPTGYGKSAIFQVLAMITPGTMLVISPLIALMKDQVDDCLKKGIPASFINSHVDESEIDDRLTLLRRGKYKLFYVAPERIGSAKFRDAVQLSQISYLTVDECHCASRWGHDFRPAYMKIHQVLRWLESGSGRPAVLAVTATATADIEEDICKSIGMTEYARVVGDPVRSNLNYQVFHGNSWTNFARTVQTFKEDGSRYVIYGGTRKACEKLADIILQEHPRFAGRVGYYHAGMPKAEREAVQDAFKAGTIWVVCATNAFGMGIDVPNIRAVVHFGIPGSIEDYCQEGGRAGRDNLPSRLCLIHSDYSVDLRQQFLDAANPRYDTFRAVWEWLHEHNNRGDVISLTLEQFAEQLFKDMNITVQSQEIGGVLSNMDSYGIVIRKASEAGVSLTCYLDRMALKLESGECNTTQAKLLEHLLAVVKPETPAAAPVPIGARSPGGLKAMVKPQAANRVEYGLDLEEVARGLRLSESAIRGQLNRLRDFGCLDIGLSFRGKTTQVAAHCWGTKLEDHIPEAVVEAKREREQNRLDAMIRYCFVPDRVSYIRSYFLGK